MDPILGSHSRIPFIGEAVAQLKFARSAECSHMTYRAGSPTITSTTFSSLKTSFPSLRLAASPGCERRRNSGFSPAVAISAGTRVQPSSKRGALLLSAIRTSSRCLVSLHIYRRPMQIASAWSEKRHGMRALGSIVCVSRSRSLARVRLHMTVLAWSCRQYPGLAVVVMRRSHECCATVVSTE